MDKIEDDVNQAVSFYQGDLENETLTSPLKVLGIMINDKAITIDSVIHFFLLNLSQGQKLPLFEILALSYYLLCRIIIAYYCL